VWRGGGHCGNREDELGTSELGPSPSPSTSTSTSTSTTATATATTRQEDGGTILFNVAECSDLFVKLHRFHGVPLIPPHGKGLLCHGTIACSKAGCCEQLKLGLVEVRILFLTPW
jgi:hypothetical protein